MVESLGAKVKIIFFDIDGTLMPFGGHVLENTYAAFDKLKEKNILTCIATGRGFAAVDLEIKALRPDFYLTVTGQHVQDSKGQKIYSNPLDPEIVAKIMEWASQEKIELLQIGAQQSAITKWTDLGRKCLTNGYEKTEEVPNFYQKHSIFQLLTVNPEHQTLKLPAELEQSVYLSRWNPLSYDIVGKNISKATGVKALLEYLNLRKEQSMAFGDEMNDFQLFNAVGYSVAMGNAKPELKNIANFVTKSTTVDGISYALETLRII